MKPLVSFSKFSQQVWFLTKKIPRGKVSTYGIIAQALKKPKAARAVGKALHKNPYAPIVPCHRVIKSDGKIGGFAGGRKNKENLLTKEGVQIVNHQVVPLKKFIYYFKT
jgi:O-6-methylguanine DNA methyltransferase